MASTRATHAAARRCFAEVRRSGPSSPGVSVTFCGSILNQPQQVRLPFRDFSLAGRTRASRCTPVVVLAARIASADARGAARCAELGDLSLEELSHIEITSVSKRAEPLSQAPAAVYVITSEDIRRSGATSLAEALRLAPNLQVARINADLRDHARGFNSVNASNKLLVLIDGRSVYTPFFSGVFWDQQDVMLDDVERIEVISGPGGTLWGANAVNGVINVITKSVGRHAGRAGRREGRQPSCSAARPLGRQARRLGHAIASMRWLRRRPYGSRNGGGAMDDWRGKQAGFRADCRRCGSAFTVQGDMYENIIDTPGGRRSGGNLLGRWTAHSPTARSLQVQAYYDQQHRSDPAQRRRRSADSSNLRRRGAARLRDRHAATRSSGASASAAGTIASSTRRIRSCSFPRARRSA